MRVILVAIVLCFVPLAGAQPATTHDVQLRPGPPTSARFEAILRVWHDPDDPTVLVVAHRGAHHGPGAGGPENSLPCIETAITMGCDMVEIDIRRTVDGHFVLMHDTTVDRTTTGIGRVDELTLEQVRELRLLDDDGVPTTLHVPTLREALLACRGRILVNLDKAGGYLAECLSLATQLGMRNHVVLKARVSPDEAEGYFQSHDLSELSQGQSETTPAFMPIVSLGKKSSEDDVRKIAPLIELQGPAIEVCFDGEHAGDRHIGSVHDLIEGYQRLWVNSLWDSISGGRSDAQAVTDPHAVWGWMVDNGVTVIQTDEPQRLLEYLRSRGLHW